MGCSVTKPMSCSLGTLGIRSVLPCKQLLQDAALLHRSGFLRFAGSSLWEGAPTRSNTFPVRLILIVAHRVHGRPSLLKYASTDDDIELSPAQTNAPLLPTGGLSTKISTFLHAEYVSCVTLIYMNFRWLGVGRFVSSCSFAEGMQHYAPERDVWYTRALDLPLERLPRFRILLSRFIH